MRKLALALVFSIFFSGLGVANYQISSASSEDEKLAAYLKSHRKSPENYVISKFSNHDIVFIGEYHRIKHDVELIHKLIPRLYKAHVYNLGIEFGCYEHQDKVDRLVTAETYDENLARWLIFQQSSSWGYKEYQDIYRAAWKLNSSLPKRARKFRVVNLNYRPDWPARKEEMTPADWQKVWWNGDPDQHMADVVMKEFVDKGEKALIYSGNHHAFTRYHQPIYDFENKRFIRFNTTRMGNLVYHKIGDRAFSIYLHAAWGSNTNSDDYTRPMQGIIDAVMQRLGNKPVGFDVKGSPFGAITDNQSYYSLGHARFTLDNYCDGYIFQGRFEDYEGVTVDPLSITEANLQEAIAYLANPAYRKRVKTPKELIEGMGQSADMKRRFKDVK
ncbi:MAG: ChaN family lipoprotein [Acidobacteriota bacterium]|nr:ChaN family lipoprotein [Acidobacteriota bacterium]